MQKGNTKLTPPLPHKSVANTKTQGMNIDQNRSTSYVFTPQWSLSWPKTLKQTFEVAYNYIFIAYNVCILEKGVGPSRNAPHHHS
jgi:hypothetical protein